MHNSHSVIVINQLCAPVVVHSGAIMFQFKHRSSNWCYFSLLRKTSCYV